MSGHGLTFEDQSGTRANRSHRPRKPASRQCSREDQDRSLDSLVLRKLWTSVSGSMDERFRFGGDCGLR